MWNHPDTFPTKIGEYVAALDPETTHQDIRRWWNGQYWSNPYSVNASPKSKERIRKEMSILVVFWKDNDD